MRAASGVLGQLEVLHAVVIRETRTRFGRHQLGYLWAVVEPVLWILTFWALFNVVGRFVPDGMDTVSFLATGLVTYMAFRDTCSRSVSAVGGNLGLLLYPQIQPLDLVMARALLELATLAVVMGLILGVNHALQAMPLAVDDWLEFVFGFGSAWMLGASLGLVLSSLNVFTPAVERLFGPVLRPTFWISGIFFTANGLPSAVREFLLYNPLLHAVEFTRSGWFPGYESRYASASYVLMWIVGLTFFGLTLERVARRRLEVA